MVKICFHTSLICIRGSTVAMFDYALYNKLLLGNQSIIVYPKGALNDSDAYKKFSDKFELFAYTDNEHLDRILLKEKCDIMYCIKYGKNDGVISNTVKNVVHCVFDLSEPHGDVYAAVSSTLAKKYNYPLYVPHMVGLKPSITKENLRIELNIPKDAIVFGRHGGLDTFDLQFAREVIINTVLSRKNIYFVFVNTPIFFKHPQIIFINKIVDINLKNKFINTCDAHIECNSLGHSFGISIGEFSVNNKKIIAYNPDGWMWNRAHIEILGDNALYYKDVNEFHNILMNFNPNDWIDKDNNFYKDYSPEKVMKIFKQVFIDPCID